MYIQVQFPVYWKVLSAILQSKDTKRFSIQTWIIDLITHEVEDVEDVRVEDVDVEDVDEDDSVERQRVTHKEALNCLETLSLYFVQQDVDDVVRLEHERGLVRLSKIVRRLEDASRKQTSIRSFLQ